MYAHFVLIPVRDEQGRRPNYPYIKPNGASPGQFFSIDTPVSSCEPRAAKCLSERISSQSGKSVLLSSDSELRASLNSSLIAFGGPGSDLKTFDAVSNDANDLLTFGGENFITALTRRPVLRAQPGFDYGSILKIYPKQFPERTWLVCAGIGEWGTSGAAWYLAYKWEEIHEFACDSPFAVVIKVRPEQDQSAEKVIAVRTRMDAETYADRAPQ